MQRLGVGVVAGCTAGSAQAIQPHRVSATLPRMPHGALQGGLCRVGRRMIIVGHAGCQVIEGSEIGYPSAGARCE